MVEIRRHRGPRACLCTKPKHDSVRIAGRYVNLRELAEQENLCHSYLSRIFSGERTKASMEYMQRIANGLKMTVDDLVDGIATRREKLRAERLRRAS